MSRIARRLPVLAVLAVLTATPTLASAGSPSYYVLKSAKAHCRSGYVKKTVTITVHKHGKKIKHKQLRCVKKGSGGGSGVTFPNLPTATVTPTIVPTVTGHTYSTVANATLKVAAPGVLSGASGHGLTAQLVSGAGAGSLALGKDGSFTYVPAGGASGIVHFTYKASDLNSTTSTPATVTIDVAPTAQNAVYLVSSGQTLSVPAAQLLGGAVGSGLVPRLVSATADGTLTLDSTGMTYTPSGAFAGADSFTYQAVDASGLVSNTATVTIDVNSVAPSVVAQAFSGAVGNTPLQVGGTQTGGLQVYQAASSPLLSGDSDPNGGGALAVTPESVSTTLGGSVIVAGDGSFTYTPPPGFDGPGADSFTYQVNTTEHTSATATATIGFTRVHVWYVDSAVATTGTGTASSPFKTFDEAAAASQTGDDIYLLTGSGDYPGPLDVPSGVAIVGQGSVLAINNEQVTLAGSAPSVTNGSTSNAGGVGISIDGDGSVTGLNVHDTAGDGVFATGTGTVTLDGMTITSSAGDGVDATGPTVLALTNSTISGSGSSLDGVVFAGPNGGDQTLAVSNDTINGQPGDAISATGFSGDAQVQVVDSTLGSTAADGIDLADSAGQLLVEAYGNTIDPSGTGILVNGAGTSELDLTLDNPKTTSPNAITAAAGVVVTGSATASCLSATSNTITSTGSGNVAIALDTGAGTFSVFNGTSPFDTYLGLVNTLHVTSGPTVSLAASSGSFTTTSVACQIPQDVHLQ